jgi:DNA-binding transcriptional regulator GbsR (MarR family)
MNARADSPELPPAAHAVPDPASAEAVRATFANAWGEIGAAWGIAPSTAAVQGYFLVHGGPLSEPEIRRALRLSHRAASLALAECEAWGLIERAEEPRRTGQRGPAAASYRVIGDNWEWFRRVARARMERETEPVVPVIERCVDLARVAARHAPADAELADLAERLEGLLRFVRLFDRGVGIFVRADPQATERLFAVLGELDDRALERLVALLRQVEPAELAGAARTLSGLSAGTLRRLVALASAPGLGRLLGR